MPPDPALLSTLTSSNYPCLELIFMVPKVFEPFKFDCTCVNETILSRDRLRDLYRRFLRNTNITVFSSFQQIQHATGISLNIYALSERGNNLNANSKLGSAENPSEEFVPFQ